MKKAKDAANWSMDAASKVKDKSRESLDRAYEAKRLFALEALTQLRADNPEAAPAQIQIILDEELMSVEAEHDGTSEDFASAVSLYVFTSLELHDFDVEADSRHQKMIDLMVVLVSTAVKVARKAVGVAAAVVMILPQARAVKGVAVAKKAIAGAAVAKGVLANKKAESRVAKTIIERTAKILGPAPKSWRDQ
jgi:hypothetical protein